MSRRGAADVLRAVGVFNRHDLASLARDAGIAPAVYIAYRSADTGRSYWPAAWQVVRPGFITDAGAHFRDNRCKTFTVDRVREEKEAQLAAAIAWANDRYGEQEWVKVPGLPGCVFPRPVADYAKALIKASKR